MNEAAVAMALDDHSNTAAPKGATASPGAETPAVRRGRIPTDIRLPMRTTFTDIIRHLRANGHLRVADDLEQIVMTHNAEHWPVKGHYENLLEQVSS